MVNGYLYTGPLPLGSVVAHNCGAAGLFSDKINPEVILEAHEVEGLYTLTVTIGDSVQIFEGPVSSMGRRQIGQALLRYLREYQGLPAEAPWGTMVGVRPTKLLHKYIDTYGSVHAATRHIRDEFSVSMEKLATLGDIGEYQRPFLSDTDDKKVSLYCGIPFCDTRCVYCSFPYGLYQDYAGKSQFLRALTRDIEDMKAIVQSYNLTVNTLYMGGGTPTVLKDEDFHQVLKQLSLLVPEGHEFTVEAGRPDSITRGKLEVLKKHNVSRISINPQTMNDETLEKIGRAHSVSDIVDCFNMAREIGFDNINMDLILGLVDEDLEMVINTLEEIKKLNPESLTVHTLAVKRASKLKEDIENYELTRYEEMIKMIDLSMEYAKEMGLNPYYMYRQKHMLGNLENIGYAKEGYECIYNIQIMEEKQSNYALGAGSISKFVYVDEDRIERVENVKNVEQYIDRVDEMIERKRKEIYQNVN